MRIVGFKCDVCNKSLSHEVSTGLKEQIMMDEARKAVLEHNKTCDGYAEFFEENTEEDEKLEFARTMFERNLAIRGFKLQSDFTVEYKIHDNGDWDIRGQAKLDGEIKSLSVSISFK